MSYTKEEVLVILSDEHRYYTERKLGRQATPSDLIEHWDEVRPTVIDGKVKPRHIFTKE